MSLSKDTHPAIGLVARMVEVPSTSRHEEGTASLLFGYLEARGARPERIGNNVIAFSRGFDPSSPTLLLNSHHDTVAPAAGYTRDPYRPELDSDGHLYGLGSNDAGASVSALLHAFLELRECPLPFNLLLALTAQEEVGGEGGVRMLMPALAERGIVPAAGIVGEPTGMRPAVAERGLVVLDCATHGVSGHAARREGVNAIYRAMADIDALRRMRFPAESAVLGPISLNITQIEAGRAHNVVPDLCRWVVDVRTTDALTNEETVEAVRATLSTHTEAVPRSTRVRASVIDAAHPLVRAAVALGGETFVSPTTSDMSLLHFPTLKMGPGLSERSHRADEFVMAGEITAAIPVYIKLIKSITSLSQI